jgi:hypothetical protein
LQTCGLTQSGGRAVYDFLKSLFYIAGKTLPQGVYVFIPASQKNIPIPASGIRLFFANRLIVLSPEVMGGFAPHTPLTIEKLSSSFPFFSFFSTP